MTRDEVFRRMEESPHLWALQKAYGIDPLFNAIMNLDGIESYEERLHLVIIEMAKRHDLLMQKIARFAEFGSTYSFMQAPATVLDKKEDDDD